MKLKEYLTRQTNQNQLNYPDNYRGLQPPFKVSVIVAVKAFNPDFYREDSI